MTYAAPSNRTVLSLYWTDTGTSKIPPTAILWPYQALKLVLVCNGALLCYWPVSVEPVNRDRHARTLFVIACKCHFENSANQVLPVCFVNTMDLELLCKLFSGLTWSWHQWMLWICLPIIAYVVLKLSVQFPSTAASTLETVRSEYNVPPAVMIAVR